jgi:hypothetical protein
MKKKTIFLFTLILVFTMMISCGTGTSSEEGGQGFKS